MGNKESNVKKKPQNYGDYTYKPPPGKFKPPKNPPPAPPTRREIMKNRNGFIEDGVFIVLLFVLILLFSILVFIFGHVDGRSTQIMYAKERAAETGYAEYDQRNGELRWIDQEVKYVVEGSEEGDKNNEE